jgi:hypothetical protein
MGIAVAGSIHRIMHPRNATHGVQISPAIAGTNDGRLSRERERDGARMQIKRSRRFFPPSPPSPPPARELRLAGFPFLVSRVSRRALSAYESHFRVAVTALPARPRAFHRTGIGRGSNRSSGGVHGGARDRSKSTCL